MGRQLPHIRRHLLKARLHIVAVVALNRLGRQELNIPSSSLMVKRR